MWIGSGIGPLTIVASTKTVVSTLSAGALLLRPFTILRTRQLIQYRSDQSVVSERPSGAYGRIVVTDNATAIGITAIPDPTTEPDAAWFVWQGMHNSFRFGSNVGFDGQDGNQYVVDSKAMRKLGNNDDLAAVVAQDAAVGATITIRGRMLIQLH